MINVAIVEEHTLVRVALVKMISSFNNLNVVLEVCDRVSLIDTMAAMPLVPNICIISSGPLIPELKTQYPGMLVLTLPEHVTNFMVTKMIREGVSGFVPKSAPPSLLKRALKTIQSGKGFWPGIDPEIIENAKHVPRSQFHIRPTHTQFMQLCASDMTYIEIAEKMEKSARTIEGYREMLCEKFGTRDRVSLVLFALRNKLISLN